MEGRTIIQWDKYDLDILGLMKVDLLSLGMLSALKKAFTMIGDPKLGLHLIPQDDPETFQMIQKADTIGTFQIESRAQMSMLPRLKPETFYDLVIEVALVRPGPIVGKMVHPYLRRRRGLEPVLLPDPRLESILGRTLGVPLFQEQVMKMAISLAGFTPGEADQLRRAIGAWRSTGSMDDMGKRLHQGLKASGLPETFCQEIFQQIQGFAEYGFPESHAASFALIAYASAYLKCHYPVEFTCALLNSQPMGFYPPHTLVDDLKRHGGIVKPPSVQWSRIQAHLEAPGVLRLGLEQIVGLERQECEKLLEEREKGPFLSIEDAWRRLLKVLKRKSLLKLAQADSFSENFPKSRGLEAREALWTLLENSQYQDLPLLRGVSSNSTVSFPKRHPLRAIQDDYHAMRLSTRGHFMQYLRQDPWKYSSAHAKTHHHRARVHAVGMLLLTQRPPTANGVMFATLEDEYGFLDLIFRKPLVEKVLSTLAISPWVRVLGVAGRDGDSFHVLVEKIQALELKPFQEAFLTD
jgi:error-prone DNA polymerase